MTTLYIITNQNGHFWGRSKQWVDGRDARALYRSPHEDEAMNTLFELSAKDVELRGKVTAASVNEKGLPEVDISDIPLPTTDTEDVAQEHTETKTADNRPSAV